MLKKIILTIVILAVLGLIGLVALIYLHEEDPNAPKYTESTKIPLVIPDDVKLTEVKAPPEARKPAPKKPAPAPKATKKPAPEPATEPAPSPVRSAKKSTPKATPSTTSAGNWVVNVASFTDSAPATSLSKKLTKSGYLSYTTNFQKDGTQWYRVRVGFYTSKDRAKVAADLIKSRHGQTGWITKASDSEKQKHLK